MPKIGNHKDSALAPCERCGSKRREGKSWTERIKTDSGEMVLYHSRIICTNRKCQREFERGLAEEKGKRDMIRKLKIENDAKRLAVKQKEASAKRTALSSSLKN